MFVMSFKIGLLFLQTSEAIWLYTLQYHIIIFFINNGGRYLFRELRLP